MKTGKWLKTDTAGRRAFWWLRSSWPSAAARKNAECGFAGLVIIPKEGEFTYCFVRNAAPAVFCGFVV